MVGPHYGPTFSARYKTPMLHLITSFLQVIGNTKKEHLSSGLDGQFREHFPKPSPITQI